MIILFPLVGFWLWASFVAAAVILGSCVYVEKYTVATIDFLALLVLLSVTGNIHLANTWSFIQANPLMIVGGALGFLAVGVVWARFKWSLLIDKLKVDVDKWRADQAAAQERAKAAFDRDFEKNSARNSRAGDPPPVFEPKPLEISHQLEGKISLDKGGKVAIKIDNFKSRIIGWMAYWPMSILVYVLGDFLHDLFSKLFKLIRAHFQQAADSKLNS